EHPGARRNPGPLFRIPIVAAAGHPLSATALGAAEGAAEHVVKVFSKRVGTYTGAKVSDFQAVQIKIARARALVDAARYLMRESAIAFDRYAERNEVPALDEKLRLRIQNTLAVMQSREAVETLWSCYGANAIYTRDPLQRYLRDTQAINQHFSFNFDIAGAAYGTVALGGKYANPTM
ncbi:MAG TPA: acyl-CoA dehydrogenase family protein, partial [Burkholderiales bacterium]|nr:acyl-CoA dehydrogenase family protein [Burkholderiales bacterium]